MLGKENDMPIGRLAARRCTAERRTPFGGNLAEGDPKGVDAGLAEAGGRRAMLAELAESGLDTKKNLL